MKKKILELWRLRHQCNNENSTYFFSTVFLSVLSFLQLLCLALTMYLFFRWLSSCCLWTCWTATPQKKKLIFLDAWGNSLIPDKLPRKSQKWLSLPLRQGCKNWKGFHFWLFQLLQKETFAGVWSQKTVTEQIKITKISICERSHIQLSCPALSQGINQPGCAMVAGTQQLQGFYRKYSQVLVLENTTLHCSCITEKRKGDEMGGKAWERQGCWSIVCPSQLLAQLCRVFMGSGDRRTRSSGSPVPLCSTWMGRFCNSQDKAAQDKMFCLRCPWDTWDPVLEQGTSLSLTLSYEAWLSRDGWNKQDGLSPLLYWFL